VGERADFLGPGLTIAAGAGLWIGAYSIPDSEHAAQYRLVMKGGGLILAAVGVWMLLEAFGADLPNLLGGAGKNPTGSTVGSQTPATDGDMALARGRVGAQFIEPANGANIDREGRLFGLFGDTILAKVRVTNASPAPARGHLRVDALVQFSDGSVNSTNAEGGTIDVAPGQSRDSEVHVPLGTSAFEVINPFSAPRVLLTATLDGDEAAQVEVTLA
jgi:hypothetical protein